MHSHGTRPSYWLRISENGARNLSIKILYPSDSEIVETVWKLLLPLVAQTVKASAYNAGDLGSVPGSGRSPGKGNGNPLQYSCLENPMDGGAWWTAIHGITKSRTWLSDFTFTFTLNVCSLRDKDLQLVATITYFLVICTWELGFVHLFIEHTQWHMGP